MYRFTFALVATFCGAATWAQARPDSLRMTCAQASALVQSNGGVLLGTGPNVYDRYVTGCRYCVDMSFLTPAWIRTADNPACYVGYRCDSQSAYAPSCGFAGYRAQ